MTSQTEDKVVYIVTGTDPHGRRIMPIRTLNKMHAMNINLYNGSVWEERNGKRKRIKQVFN